MLYWCMGCGAWVESYIDENRQRRCKECDTQVWRSK